MFSRIKERLITIEVVLDALLSLLHRKELVTKSEMQIEILARAQEEEREHDL